MENQGVNWAEVPLPSVWLGITEQRTYYRLRFDFHPVHVDAMQSVFPRHWSKPAREWRVPVSDGSLASIKAAFGDALQIDPSVTEVLDAAAKQIQATEALKLTMDMGQDVPLPAGVYFNNPPPFNHQKRALALCLSRPAFGLFAEMGTGKTRVMVDLLGYLKRKTLADGGIWEPALVFCPVAVLENWVREIQKYQPTLRAVALIKGTSTDKTRLLHASREENSGIDLIAVNYETAWRMDKEFKAYYWSTVILDESTKIKNRASKQGKAAVKIGLWGRRRYILTGTPMPNSPLEFFNQIKFLDPTVFGPSFYAFRDRYAIMGGYQGYQVVGWKNLEELSRKVSAISYSIKKKDCLDLPDKIYKEYRFPMTEQQGVAYRQMAEDLVTEFQGQVISVDVMLAKLTKLRQIASGFLYAEDRVLRFEGHQKLTKCLEIIDLVVDDHKLVVWGLFKEEMDAIEKGIGELNGQRHKEGRKIFKHVRLDGSVPGAKRAGLVDQFQERDETRIFLGQQHAGGLGITLTAADYCIFYSNDFSPEIRYQAEDRLHRIGQRKNVTYIDLLTRGTVDVSIKAALARKRKLADVVENAGLKEVLYGGGIEDASFEPQNSGLSTEISFDKTPGG